MVVLTSYTVYCILRSICIHILRIYLYIDLCIFYLCIYMLRIYCIYFLYIINMSFCFSSATYCTHPLPYVLVEYCKPTDRPTTPSCLPPDLFLFTCFIFCFCFLQEVLAGGSGKNDVAMDMHSFCSALGPEEVREHDVT